MSDEYSIVMYHGEFNKSSCGYCKKANTCNSHGMTAHMMAVRDYQDLIDRGWRRSGTYCYKPCNSSTCCPSYTIRCDALQFKMSKSHKKIIKRLNKFLRDGVKESTEKEISQDAEVAGDEIPMAVQMVTDAIDVSQIVNKLPPQQEEPQLCTSLTSAVIDVASGSSVNTSKPPCKKAKLLRMERKQAKLAQREAQGLAQVPTTKPPKNLEKTLEDFLAEAPQDGKHKLRVKLIPSTKGATDETLALYRKYQSVIHHDPPQKNSRDSFVRFLCRSPLQIDLICATGKEFLPFRQVEYELYKKYQTLVHKDPPEDIEDFEYFLQRSPLQLKVSQSSPAKGYGSFHQQYWLDDRLIAVGVIDVLPYCVSSVYLFYDPEFSFLSLGTYSSLREVAFTRELQKTCGDLKYYYMGFYIHSCPKMRYKGKLQPSFLLCPEVYTWHPITEDLLKKLDRSKYSRFNEDVQARDKDEFQGRHLESVVCLYDNTIMYFKDYIDNKFGEINNFLCDCCKEDFTKLVQIKEENYTEVTHWTSEIVKEEENVYTENIEVLETENFFKKDNVESSEGTKFQCNECMKEFSKKSQIIYHMRIHMKDLPFKCDECPKKFSVKSSVVRHKLINHSGEKPFKCKVCSKAFANKGYIKFHMKIHTGEKPFKCRICLRAFLHKTGLIRHMSIHTGEKPFKCRECLRAFLRKSSLIRHMSIHIEEKPFKCEICSKGFISKGCLITHMKTHTGEKPFKCEICLRAFSLKSHLTSHLKTHTEEKPFKCGECLRAFSVKSYLTSHLKKVHIEKKPFKCDKCPKIFSKKSALTCHKRSHREKEPFKCEQCLKTFTRKFTLTNHMRAHTGDKPFKCDECSKVFSRMQSLIYHMRSHKGKESFQCEKCLKTFYLKGNLKIHMRIHTGEKPFKCNECPRTFARKTNLTIHERFHTGEEPFKCEICFKSFSQKIGLKFHLRIHAGEKPFNCKICSKAFTNKGNLRSHLRIHAGDTPYKCEVCPKAFLLKSWLIRHTRTHTGEKPFKCSECSRGFSRKSHLVSHERSHRKNPFKCAECSREFPEKSKLLSHMSIHTGEKPFKCGECLKTFTRKWCLSVHGKTVHRK